MKIPFNVKKIISVLEDNGYEAYIVGGCVRDSYLGITPKDWDITTSAMPSVVKRLFKHTVDTGIKHGTVTVIMDKIPYEVTTYRIDGEYLDSRHPKEVIYTKNIVEDLLRRDFTINAMAYNDKDGLIDEFFGIKDLENHIIRCVGNPYDRFKEDALRMLRAVRFSARFGFEIEENTKKAIKELSHTLSKISMERIREEFVQILVSDYPEKIDELYRDGLLDTFLPEWDEMVKTSQNSMHHIYNVSNHTIHTLKNIENTRVLRLSALFHDIGKPYTKVTDNNKDHFDGHEQKSAYLALKIMKRLKFDNKTIKKVTSLVRFHNLRINDKKELKSIMSKTSLIIFPEIFELNKADILAQSEYKRGEKLDKLYRVRKMYQKIMQDKEPLFIKDLDIKGEDLLKNGIKKGKYMGEILNRLLDIVIENPQKNKKEILLDEALNIYNKETI